MLKCQQFRLFQIAPFRVTRRVVRQEAEDKQCNKEGNNNIDGNFEGDHTNISRGIKDQRSADTARLLSSSYRNAVPFLFCARAGQANPVV